MRMKETNTTLPPAVEGTPPGATIYESAPVASDDDFWLEQGNKLLAESVNSVRSAATELLKAAGLLRGIYLGILGFAELVPKTLAPALKALFVLPVVPLVVTIYLCLRVLMTESLTVNPHSPSEIRKALTTLANQKQKKLKRAFAAMSVGLLLALGLLVFKTQF